MVYIVPSVWVVANVATWEREAVSGGIEDHRTRIESYKKRSSIGVKTNIILPNLCKHDYDSKMHQKYKCKIYASMTVDFTKDQG